MACLALEISTAIRLCCKKREYINSGTLALVSILAQANGQNLFSSFLSAESKYILFPVCAFACC